MPPPPDARGLPDAVRRLNVSLDLVGRDIDGFLDECARAGLPVSRERDPERRLQAICALHELAQAGLAITDAGQLARLIAPVIATAPDHAEILQRIAQGYVRARARPIETGRAIDREPDASRRPRTGIVASLMRAASAFALLIIVAAVLGGAYALYSLVTWSGPVPTPVPDPIPPPPGLPDRTALVPELVLVIDLAWRLAITVPIALICAYHLERWRRRHAPPRQSPTPETSRGVPVAKSGFLSGLRARWAADQLRRHIAVPARGIDVERSVAASARAGGRPVAVPRHNKLEIGTVVLLDVERPQEAFSYLTEALARRFKGARVAYAAYHYAGTPRHARTPAATSLIPLRDLARRHAGEQLVLIGDGLRFAMDGGALDPQIVDALEAFDRVIWLTPTPVDNQGSTEAAMARLGVLVMPISEDGLEALARALAGGDVPRMPSDTRSRAVDAFLRYLAEEETTLTARLPPPSETIAWLIGSLRATLGGNGFHILAALAVLRRFDGDIIVALGRAALDQPVKTADLGALSRLPWIAAGAMPPWLRAAILADLDPGEAADIRNRTARWLALTGRPGGYSQDDIIANLDGTVTGPSYLASVSGPLPKNLDDPLFRLALAGGALPDPQEAGRVDAPPLTPTGRASARTERLLQIAAVGLCLAVFLSAGWMVTALDQIVEMIRALLPVPDDRLKEIARSQSYALVVTGTSLLALLLWVAMRWRRPEAQWAQLSLFSWPTLAFQRVDQLPPGQERALPAWTGWRYSAGTPGAGWRYDGLGLPDRQRVLNWSVPLRWLLSQALGLRTTITAAHVEISVNSVGFRLCGRFLTRAFAPLALGRKIERYDRISDRTVRLRFRPSGPPSIPVLSRSHISPNALYLGLAWIAVLLALPLIVIDYDHASSLDIGATLLAMASTLATLTWLYAARQIPVDAARSAWPSTARSAVPPGTRSRFFVTRDRVPISLFTFSIEWRRWGRFSATAVLSLCPLFIVLAADEVLMSEIARVSRPLSAEFQALSGVMLASAFLLPVLPIACAFYFAIGALRMAVTGLDHLVTQDGTASLSRRFDALLAIAIALQIKLGIVILWGAIQGTPTILFGSANLLSSSSGLVSTAKFTHLALIAQFTTFFCLFFLVSETFGRNPTRDALPANALLIGLATNPALLIVGLVLANRILDIPTATRGPSITPVEASIAIAPQFLTTASMLPALTTFAAIQLCFGRGISSSRRLRAAWQTILALAAAATALVAIGYMMMWALSGLDAMVGRQGVRPDVVITSWSATTVFVAVLAASSVVLFFTLLVIWRISPAFEMRVAVARRAGLLTTDPLDFFAHLRSRLRWLAVAFAALARGSIGPVQKVSIGQRLLLMLDHPWWAFLALWFTGIHWLWPFSSQLAQIVSGGSVLAVVIAYAVGLRYGDRARFIVLAGLIPHLAEWDFVASNGETNSLTAGSVMTALMIWVAFRVGRAGLSASKLSDVRWNVVSTFAAILFVVALPERSQQWARGFLGPIYPFGIHNGDAFVLHIPLISDISALVLGAVIGFSRTTLKAPLAAMAVVGVLYASSLKTESSIIDPGPWRLCGLMLVSTLACRLAAQQLSSNATHVAALRWSVTLTLLILIRPVFSPEISVENFKILFNITFPIRQILATISSSQGFIILAFPLGLAIGRGAPSLTTLWDGDLRQPAILFLVFVAAIYAFAGLLPQRGVGAFGFVFAVGGDPSSASLPATLFLAVFPLFMLGQFISSSVRDRGIFTRWPTWLHGAPLSSLIEMTRRLCGDVQEARALLARVTPKVSEGSNDLDLVVGALRAHLTPSRPPIQTRSFGHLVDLERDFSAKVQRDADALRASLLRFAWSNEAREAEALLTNLPSIALDPGDDATSSPAGAASAAYFARSRATRVAGQERSALLARLEAAVEAIEEEMANGAPSRPEALGDEALADAQGASADSTATARRAHK